MSNWGRAVIISIFILFLLLCPMGSAEIMPMTIDHAGNLVAAENSIFSIEIDYSTDGTTYANITSKTFTGDADFGIGYNSHEINGIESIDLYNPHVVELDPSTQSHTFYYVTGFTPRISEPLDYGNEYNPQQYVVQHKVFSGYDNESNTSIWTPTTSVVAFDSQVNNGANYTATWHTKHSRVEDWVNLGRFGVFERDYDGKDTWMITQNRYIEAGQSYQLRIIGDVPIRFGEYSYKFDFVTKPSSETLSQAILNNHFYVVDPLWNSSYNIRLKMSINNTAGAGVLTYFQMNTNISSYDVNASSTRCYNRTSGTIIPHWNETVNNGIVYELWTNNTAITSGWDNNYFCAWQTIPTTSSSSSISNTFIFGDDFTGDLSKWTIVTETPSIVSNILELSASDNDEEILRSDNTYSIGKALRIKQKTSVVDMYAIHGMTDTLPNNDIYDGDTIFLYVCPNSNYYYRTGNNGPYTQTTDAGYHDTSWHINEFQWLSGDVNFVEDGTEVSSHTTNIPDADMYVYLRSGYPVHPKTGTAYVDWVIIRKCIDNEPIYENIILEHYSNSLHYNATQEVNNTIYSNPAEITLNRSAVIADDTNDTAGSTGLSYIEITNYNNSVSIVRNFTIMGDDLDWYQVVNISGSHDMKNSSGTIQTANYGNFTTNLVAGDYWIESATSSTYTISGMIYGAAGLGEGQVTVTLGSDSTTTTSSGAYSFTGVSVGTYTLTASKPGLQDASTTITVSGDTTQDLTMVRAVSPAGGGQQGSDWGLPFNISGPISRLDGLFAPLQVPSDPGKINLFWYCILGFGAFMFIDGTTFRFDNSRKAPVIKLKYLISAPLSLILMFLGLLYIGLINWNSVFFINTFDGLGLSFSSAISPILGVSSPLGAVGYVLVGTGILVLGVLFFIDGLAFCVDKSRENTFLKIKYQVLIAAGLGLGVLGAAVSGLVIFS